ncbi:hypothetical protein SNEBB_007318 [Seison nebaliae]|nr:hypothetical protein SNEBB_007318 [Seison nebaliae]
MRFIYLLKLIITSVVVTILWNEIFIYYFVFLFRCQWPHITAPIYGERPFHFFVIADTHFLGSVHGHWIDRLRREHQMSMAYSASNTIFYPHLTIFNGDITDEGKWCSDNEWKETVERFQSKFNLQSQYHVRSKYEDRQIQYIRKHSGNNHIVVVGNHDVGFHDSMNQKKIRRFENLFDNGGQKSSDHFVHIYEISSQSHAPVPFFIVTLNSMAFKRDSCTLCAEAEIELKSVANYLKEYGSMSHKQFNRTFLFSHFPLYRTSEALDCDDNLNFPDEMPSRWRNSGLAENFDVLSRNASDYIIETIRPNAIFTAHTHYYCHRQFKQIDEWTAASYM